MLKNFSFQCALIILPICELFVGVSSGWLGVGREKKNDTVISNEHWPSGSLPFQLCCTNILPKSPLISTHCSMRKNESLSKFSFPTLCATHPEFYHPQNHILPLSQIDKDNTSAPSYIVSCQYHFIILPLVMLVRAKIVKSYYIFMAL